MNQKSLQKYVTHSAPGVCVSLFTLSHPHWHCVQYQIKKKAKPDTIVASQTQFNGPNETQCEMGPLFYLEFLSYFVLGDPAPVAIDLEIIKKKLKPM